MGDNPQSPTLEGSWQTLLDGVVPAIVALQVIAVRSFQDDHAGAHGGTGFVVDAERGLLLTNRHVCICGPARRTATFVGCPAMEEVLVHVAYVDPVHDFALLRFDPQQLQQTPRAEIALDPAGLRVGEEIRVVGNDSLEKLQILSGTVARVDRNPPELSGDYHDENSFYALASSGTRGGSSGSPVLNRQGRAIALNAAAKESTMHAFYLPLHHVGRALKAVQSGESIPRGTLCAAFSYTSFPEVLRLGVDREFVRHSILEREPPLGGTFSKAMPPGGMLQVHRTLPGTPAASALQPGDVLLELEGVPCADFVLLGAALDARVGRSVRLGLCRQGQRVDVELEVQDQHDLIPHAFLELGLGVFHKVPYQTAMKHHIPVAGVYVAQAGIVFGESIKTDAVITDVNGTPCTDLEAFEQALQQIQNKEYFAVGWTVPRSAQERRRCVSSVKMQRHWCAFRFWTLDRASQKWVPRNLGAAKAAGSVDNMADATAMDDAAADEIAVAAGETAGTAADIVTASPKKRARRSGPTSALPIVKTSLCSVVFRTVPTFDMDLVVTASNVENDTYCCRGAGVVLDPAQGLVLTDRATVPQPLGDIEVTLGEDTRSASVCFVHPLHSLVVLRVDPGEGGHAFGKAASFCHGPALEPGDPCEFIGMDPKGRAVASKVQVQSVRMCNFPSHFPPRWRESFLEAIVLADNAMSVNTGVLCDAKGNVKALYAVTTFIQEEESERLGYGIPCQIMQPLLEHFKIPKGLSAPFVVPSLEIGLEPVELSRLARLPAKLRPPAAWVAKLSASSTTALQVRQVMAGGPCDGLACAGDLLVAVEGEVVTSCNVVERRLFEAMGKRPAEARGGTVAVQLVVLRQGKATSAVAHAQLLPSDGTTRFLCWHGLLLRETPRSVREFGAVPGGVHISQTLLGSPGEADGVEGDILVAVNGVPTRTLDEVVGLAHDSTPCRGAASSSGEAPAKSAVPAQERRHLRVETADSSGRRFMRPLEPDPLFWPLLELTQGPAGAWVCEEHRADA